ncbi:hypothetical protein [Paracoccus tegillarcae]|uniref:hypothetical protein n=1 Tax=Paracoccus tegillarcae TaxID=1529068 RepID=UPI0013006AA2|nr:hypothetical protein [Paracoccus tegillarcae]
MATALELGEISSDTTDQYDMYGNHACEGFNSDGDYLQVDALPGLTAIEGTPGAEGDWGDVTLTEDGGDTIIMAGGIKVARIEGHTG